jgi:hypothetical protein
MASAIDCQVTNSFEGVIQYQVEMTNTPGGCLIKNVALESRMPSRMSFAFLFMEQDKAVKQDSHILRNQMKLPKCSSYVQMWDYDHDID